MGFDDIDDVFDHHADLLEINGTFVASRADRVNDFFAIKVLPSSIAFDHEETIAHHGFGGAEAVAAFDTFASATNRVTLPADPGVDYFIVNRSALWAAHSGLVEREKVLKDEHALFSGNGLGMKLDAPDRESLMA